MHVKTKTQITSAQCTPQQKIVDADKFTKEKNERTTMHKLLTTFDLCQYQVGDFN